MAPGMFKPTVTDISFLAEFVVAESYWVVDPLMLPTSMLSTHS